jgi:hypothetical protein
MASAPREPGERFATLAPERLMLDREPAPRLCKRLTGDRVQPRQRFVVARRHESVVIERKDAVRPRRHALENRS